MAFVGIERGGERVVAAGPGPGSRRDCRGRVTVARTKASAPPRVTGLVQAGGYVVGCELASAHANAREGALMLCMLE